MTWRCRPGGSGRVVQAAGDWTTTLWCAPAAGLVKMTYDGRATVRKEFQSGK